MMACASGGAHLAQLAREAGAEPARSWRAQGPCARRRLNGSSRGRFCRRQGNLRLDEEGRWLDDSDCHYCRALRGCDLHRDRGGHRTSLALQWRRDVVATRARVPAFGARVVVRFGPCGRERRRCARLQHEVGHLLRFTVDCGGHVVGVSLVTGKLQRTEGRSGKTVRCESTQDGLEIQGDVSQPSGVRD